jgi:hypothetical protein
MKRLSRSWVLVLWVLALMLGLLLPALAQEGGVASKVKNEGASDNASSMLPQKTFIHLLQAAEDESSNPDKRLASHPLLSPTGLGDPDLKPSFLVILDYAQQVTTSPISFEQTVTGRIPASSERGGYLYETQYVLDVPSGVDSFWVELHGGPGDIDLFMRFGSPVTPHYPPHCWLDETEYDWKSSTDGPDEEIRVSNPRPGRYYIAVCNWASSPQPFQLTPHGPPQPVLSVSPTSLTFSAQEGGSNPASQAVTVRNSGGGTLNWSGTSSVGWLRLSPTSGSLTGGNSQSVSVSVNISGMAAGTYTGNITFSAPGAQGSPQVVLVTLTIRGAVQPGAGQLVVLKFIKLEFVNAADWVRSERGSFIIYTNISSSPSPLRVTMPDNQVLEFNIPPNKEVIVCGDVVHIDTRP